MTEESVSVQASTSTAQVKIALRDVKQIFEVRDENSASRKTFTALNGINFEVKAGEFVAVVGPSGCGKSTLLDLLAGLSLPSSGQLLIDNHPVTGPALDRGIVLQGYALFPWRTVQQNVEFGLEIKNLSRSERHQIAERFIHLVGLQEFSHRYPHELSGGMRQRVALARALAFDPDILLMDEPFAAVDAQTREVLQDELLHIWETTGKTVLLVTHSIEEAVFLADRVIVLSSSPAIVRDIITIDLPRPRTAEAIRSSAEFSELRHRIWQLLQTTPSAQLQ